MWRNGKLKRVVRRRKVWKLKKMRVSFEKKRVEELINAEAPDLWRSFKDGILKACDELCRKEGSIQTPVKKTRS